MLQGLGAWAASQLRGLLSAYFPPQLREAFSRLQLGSRSGVSLPFENPMNVCSLLGPEAAEGLGDLLWGDPERRRPGPVSVPSRRPREAPALGQGHSGPSHPLSPLCSWARPGALVGHGHTDRTLTPGGVTLRDSHGARLRASQGPESRVASIAPSLKPQREAGPPRKEPWRGQEGTEEWGWRGELAFPFMCRGPARRPP